MKQILKVKLSSCPPFILSWLVAFPPAEGHRGYPLPVPASLAAPLIDQSQGPSGEGTLPSISDGTTSLEWGQQFSKDGDVIFSGLKN